MRTGTRWGAIKKQRGQAMTIKSFQVHNAESVDRKFRVAGEKAVFWWLVGLGVGVVLGSWLTDWQGNNAVVDQSEKSAETARIWP